MIIFFNTSVSQELFSTIVGVSIGIFYWVSVRQYKHISVFNELERFSFKSRKVIGFGSTTLHDWLKKKKLAPLFHPIRSKSKNNHGFLAHVFPRFASATCNYFELSLVHWIVRVCAYFGFVFTKLNWKPLYRNTSLSLKERKMQL